MEIVKELNKDGGYESIKNGSMTHAVNAMVSRDGNSIQNEQSIETIIALEENEEIVGVISCSSELVIFTNNNKIRRYKESDKSIEEVITNWNHQGGKVIGTYTYNVNNELIVAITELNADEDVPLKIINLNKPNYLENGNDIKYTLSPNIPKTNLNNWKLVVGAPIYKGIYNIFIRYKEGDSYTGWFPIGYPIIVWDKDNTVVVEDSSYGYDYTTKGNGNHKYEIGNFKFRDMANTSAEKVSYNIELGISIDNDGLNYDRYQIGYVISTQSGATKVFNTSDISINTSRITIDDIHNEEFSLDDITTSFFNLYNIKTLCNYNNRLYVANYKEENVNEIVKTIDTSGIQVKVKDYYDNSRNIRATRAVTKSSNIILNPTEFKVGYGYVVTIQDTIFDASNQSNTKSVTRKFFLSRLGYIEPNDSYCLPITNQSYYKGLYYDSNYDTTTQCIWTSNNEYPNKLNKIQEGFIITCENGKYVIRIAPADGSSIEKLYPSNNLNFFNLTYLPKEIKKGSDRYDYVQIKFGYSGNAIRNTYGAAPDIDYVHVAKVISIEEFALDDKAKEVIEPLWFYKANVTFEGNIYPLIHNKFYYNYYTSTVKDKSGDTSSRWTQYKYGYQYSYVDIDMTTYLRNRYSHANYEAKFISEVPTVNPDGKEEYVSRDVLFDDLGFSKPDYVIIYDIAKNEFKFGGLDEPTYSSPKEHYAKFVGDKIAIKNKSTGEIVYYTPEQLIPDLAIEFTNLNKTTQDLINEISHQQEEKPIYEWEEDKEPTANDFNPNNSYNITDFYAINTLTSSGATKPDYAGRKFTDCKVYEVATDCIKVDNKYIGKKRFMIVIPYTTYNSTLDKYGKYTIEFVDNSRATTETEDKLISDRIESLYLCFEKTDTFDFLGVENYNCSLVSIPHFEEEGYLNFGTVLSTGALAYNLASTNSYLILDLTDDGLNNGTAYSGYRAEQILSDEEQPEDNTYSTVVSKTAINYAVYNFFIHYVYPNGNITNGIPIRNNMEYSETISLGKTSDNVELTMDITEDTLISNVRTKYEAYKSQYGTIDINNAHEVIKTGLYETLSNVRFCNVFPKYNGYGIALYKNNKGDRMFRGIADSYSINHNYLSYFQFTFDNIPVRKEFVGYFISYERTEPILVAHGIAVRKDDDFNTAFDEQVTDIRFYYPEFDILKKSPSGNIFMTENYLDKVAPKRGVMFTDYYDAIDGTAQSGNTEEFNETRGVKSVAIISPDDKDNNNIGREGVSIITLNKSLRLKSIINTTNDLIQYNTATLLNISDNLYMSENKDLIPLGYIKYYNINSRANNNYGYEDYPYNYDYYPTDGYVYAFNRNGVYYDASDPIPKKANDNSNLYPNFPQVFYDRYGNVPIQRRAVATPSLYPLFAKTIKSAPDERYYTIHTDDNSFVQNVRMLHMLPSTINDTFEISSIYVDYAGKKFINYNEVLYSNFVTEYRQTIRRSDVISDESIENKWRIFRPNAYKIISENKGNIMNIVGIGLYLIAHCEHSMFIFNRDNTLYTKDKDVQMLMPDAFDIDYQEVFTSEKGYGGLQDLEAYVCNEIGYIFLDRSKKRLYRFDEKNLNDLGDGVQSILDEYLTDDTQILMGMDKENNRLICSFMGEESDFTLSYNFVTNTWISIHTYLCRGFYNTKTNLYISSFNKKNIIGQIGFVKSSSYLKYTDFEIPIDKNPFYIGENNNTMVVDILFNIEYDTIKVLNYISYDLYKANDINFAGNKILLFSNTSISRLEDITVNERNTFDIAKPYYEHGKWNYNYFRSVLNDVVTNYPIDRLTGKLNVDIDKKYEPFKSNLINGKYLGVRFIINDGTAKIEIKKIECYVNKYRE